MYTLRPFSQAPLPRGRLVGIRLFFSARSGVLSANPFWAMYAPELKANSDEIKLNVED